MQMENFLDLTEAKRQVQVLVTPLPDRSVRSKTTKRRMEVCLQLQVEWEPIVEHHYLKEA